MGVPLKFPGGPRQFAAIVNRREALKARSKVERQSNVPLTHHPVLARLVAHVEDRQQAKEEIESLYREQLALLKAHFPHMLVKPRDRNKKKQFGHVKGVPHLERTMFWNFKVGDRVRITQGADRYKYEPLKEGEEQLVDEDGLPVPRTPRIWKIMKCNKDQNTVLLEGLMTERPHPRPSDPNRPVSSDFARKRPIYHPIRVSDLQLQIPQACFLEMARDAGYNVPAKLDPFKFYRGLDGIPDFIFATKLRAGPIELVQGDEFAADQDQSRSDWMKGRLSMTKFQWDRLVVETTPPMALPTEISVPWPEETPVSYPIEPTSLDTPADVVAEVTYNPPTLAQILAGSDLTSNDVPDLYLDSIASLAASSSTPVPSADEAFTTSPGADAALALAHVAPPLPMELFAGKELANPYSKRRILERAALRRAREDAEGADVVSLAVETWKAREERVRLGLEPRIGRKMTTAEVVLTARRRFAETLVARRMEEHRVWKEERRERLGPDKTERKLVRRAKRKAGLAEALSRTTLLEGKNQVIPEHLKRSAA